MQASFDFVQSNQDAQPTLETTTLERNRYLERDNRVLECNDPFQYEYTRSGTLAQIQLANRTTRNC